MTAFGDVDAAVTAVKAGAHDFLTKPFQSPDALAHSVAKAAEHGRLVARTRRLEKELEVRERYGDIVGSSPLMREVYSPVEAVAHSTSTSAPAGRDGHGQGAGRAGDPQPRPARGQAVRRDQLRGHPGDPASRASCSATCAAPSPAPIETRVGLFEAANGGTLFLDEIGDLPLARAGQAAPGARRRARSSASGSSESHPRRRPGDRRDERDLQQAMRDKRFREDLYYRLNVITIPLPPLRDRPDDIPLLAYHFLRKYTARAGRERRADLGRGDARAHEPLLAGQRARARERDRAVRGDVARRRDPPRATCRRRSATPGARRRSPRAVLLDLPFADAKHKAIEQFEAGYAFGTLRRAGGNVSEAARQAGMDRPEPASKFELGRLAGETTAPSGSRSRYHRRQDLVVGLVDHILPR